MMDATSIGMIAATVLVALAAAGHFTLKGWQGWLELKRLELASRMGGDVQLPPATGRIELADLRERVRKLEAIAAGIDL